MKEHQVKAALHLCYIKNGANFSVPGSGKTTVVLTVYEKLRLEGKVNCLLLLVHRLVLGPGEVNLWKHLEEIPDYYIFAGDHKINREIEYYKTKDFHELYLTSFHTLLNDVNDVIELLSTRNLKAFVVIDELII